MAAKELAMIPDDVERSLRTGEPKLERLDDGFSPPTHEPPPVPAEPAAPLEPALTSKSPF